MYFWLQWRWRRLRDVTLPTPRKEGSFASSAAVFGRSATIFVSRIVMKLGAWATQSNPIEHWHPVGQVEAQATEPTATDHLQIVCRQKRKPHDLIVTHIDSRFQGVKVWGWGFIVWPWVMRPLQMPPNAKMVSSMG